MNVFTFFSKSKKTGLYTFLELLHAFSRTLVGGKAAFSWWETWVSQVRCVTVKETVKVEDKKCISAYE